MKNRPLILLLFTALIFPSVSSLAQTVTPRNPQVEKILREISPGSIKLIIEKLASFGTRHTVSVTDSNTRGIGAAPEMDQERTGEVLQGKRRAPQGRT
jgi:hypothetical protein